MRKTIALYLFCLFNLSYSVINRLSGKCAKVLILFKSKRNLNFS